ncbi:MAG: hypothetical protein SFV51_10735, partial [Bryobacteraceae bacterium]|nr:hypothetical protein [Bryobacteraceae bacterium]
MFGKRRRDRETELAREIRAHIELEAEDSDLGGARRQFGNVTAVQEECREAWGWSSLERIRQDVKFGWRSARANAAYSLVAIATLGLGIGANSAVFSVVHGVLLRPL